MNCILTETTRLALVPQGQDTCLLVRDPNGEPLGTLSLEVEKITLECLVKNDYYTRSFNMKVDSSKRCSTQGSCTGNKCGDIHKDSKIDELSGTPNESPGFTYCAESCGCWACECFICTAGCLFYRTYAVPATDTVYEVFSCPVWQFKVSATARITLQGETTSHNFDLRPGTGITWRNMKLTLISITNPPVPILGSQFLTDGSKTVMVKASNGGQPISGTIGELQCANREKASVFDCYLPHDNCQCQPQETQASCYCTERTLESLFTEIEHVIPIQTQGISIFGSGRNLEAEYNGIASLEVQVSLEGFKLSTKIEKNKCVIKPIAFAGCYSCLTGAKLKFECHTDFGEALAHVKCGKGTFSTICTNVGVKATAAMTFSQAHVSETCEVNCPAGTTNFKIDGTLVFIDKDRSGKITNVITTDRKSNDGIDFGFLSSWLSGNWVAGIIIIIIVIILLIITIPLLPVLLKYLINNVPKLCSRLLGKITKLFKNRNIKNTKIV